MQIDGYFGVRLSGYFDANTQSLIMSNQQFQETKEINIQINTRGIGSHSRKKPVIEAKPPNIGPVRRKIIFKINFSRTYDFPIIRTEHEIAKRDEVENMPRTRKGANFFSSE